MLAILLIACGPTGCRFNRDHLAWTSIDVNIPSRQGDAHLLTVNSKRFMIDVGPRETADRLIAFLKSNKCSELQFIIITHGHNDHYGALVPLINSGIKIGCVYFNPPHTSLVTNEPWGCSVADFNEISDFAGKKNIPIAPIDNRMEWRLGKDIFMRVVCVFNGLDTPIGRTDINDTSAVIMLVHGNVKILFAADLNRALGKYLTQHIKPERLHADLLKFPHHGTESFPHDDFFSAVNPKAFIVPSPKELWLSDRSARARRITRGKETWINGIDGNITVVSDGVSFRISSDRMR